MAYTGTEYIGVIIYNLWFMVGTYFLMFFIKGNLKLI